MRGANAAARPRFPLRARPVRGVLAAAVIGALVATSLLGTALALAPHLPRARAGIVEAAVATPAPTVGSPTSPTPTVATAASHPLDSRALASVAGAPAHTPHRAGRPPRAPRGAVVEQAITGPRTDEDRTASGPVALAAAASVTAAADARTTSAPADRATALARFVSKASRTRGQPVTG